MQRDGRSTLGSRVELAAPVALGKISVLLPAYNEEGSIKLAYQNISSVLSKTPYKFEIIVIDDGSTDRTREFANEILGEHLKLVGYPSNRGKGEALRFGSTFASGEFSIFLDSDCEIDPWNVNLYIKALSGCDIAIGSKRNVNSKVSQPFVRRVLSLGFNAVVQLLTRTRITDTQCGFKAFRTSALEQIMPLISVKKYAFDVEILTVATLLGMRIKELPVNVDLKASFPLRSMIRMGVDVLGIAYRLNILKWYQKNLTADAPKYDPILKW